MLTANTKSAIDRYIYGLSRLYEERYGFFVFHGWTEDDRGVWLFIMVRDRDTSWVESAWTNPQDLETIINSNGIRHYIDTRVKRLHGEAKKFLARLNWEPPADLQG